MSWLPPGPTTEAATPSITAQLSATFPPIDPSVSKARRFVREALVGWGAEAVVDDAVLLASELVTNAIVHAGTGAEVVCTLEHDAVRVDVVDRYPTRWLPPAPPEVDPEALGGRGLQMATELSTAWGVEYSSAAKRVWFRLALPAPAAVPTEPAAADALAAAPAIARRAALVRLDGDGVVCGWDDGAAALLGWTAEEALGSAWLDLLAVEDAERVGAAAGRGWHGPYGARHREGHVVSLQARHVAVEGWTLCLLVDHRLRALLPAATAPAPAREGAEADTPPGLPSTAALVRLELDDLLARTVAWARDTVAGDGAFALLATDAERELELRWASGLHGDLPRRLPVSEEGVAGRLVRGLLPTVHDDLQSGSPDLAWLAAAGARSLVMVPLFAEGRRIGALGVTSERPGRFTNEDGARLQRAADALALPVQTARLTEIERRRRGWLSYLAEASDLLAGTLQLEMTLALVAQLLVPRLGSWCGIYLHDESGNPAPAYVWHADEERLEDLRELLEKAPPPTPTTDRAARRWVPADGLSLQGTEPYADLAAASSAVVPLVARGRAIGTLTLGRSAAEPLQPETLEMAADLARRAALALDNARLYADRTATSNALQRSLLPPELPDLPGVDVGVVYAAAGEGNEVGGDFYDLFPVPGGRFAFAVGDVCGKGPEAAAVTGLARHALRLLGRRGDSIPEVLGQLNAAILDEGSRTRFVTVIYGDGEPGPGDVLRLRLASCGHPLPFVVAVDGSVRMVGTPGDLLGVFEELQTVVFEVQLVPGELLVCFTDGVTERRDGTRMLGEDGVRAALDGAAGLPAAAVARRLQTAVASFAPEPPRDDLAILVLRAR